VDELSVLWGPIASKAIIGPPGRSTHCESYWRHEVGRAQLELAARTVARLNLSVAYGCRVCGSAAHGTPFFADGWSAYVGCSLTYVHGFALVVLSLQRSHPNGRDILPGPLPIGVDAEFVHQSGDLGQDIARRILNARETEGLTRLDSRDAPVALLRAWTEKEAVLKASGLGLSVDPRMVSTAIGTSVGTSTVDLDFAGRTQRYHVWRVPSDGFPEPWMVSVATADTVRARLATVRLVPKPA
jgi:phosphopantetheinyl transferase